MDQKTIETYNQQAKEYDENTIDFWEKFPSTFLDIFAKSVLNNSSNNSVASVLDVGSGPGRDALLLETKGLKVTCLDASHTMVELSKARGLASLVGDFNELPFPENSFDGVWAYTSLLHVPKAEIGKPLAEIYRVLSAGGIFGFGLIEGHEELYRESSGGMTQPRWFSYYTKEEIEELLGTHGFEVVHFETFKPGSRTYLNFISRKK